MAPGAKFRSNFTFGSPTAESDPLLHSAYYDNGDYEAISSHYDHRCFIIGRTGSGKSAAFKRLEEQNPEKVVRIIPENLSLPYITNLDVTRQLLALGVRLEPFFKALWKHVFVVELIKHRYRIDSPEKRTNILTQIRKRLQMDSSKMKALDYLEEFGDKFWAETNERVRQIAESFEQRITAAGGIEGALSAIGLSGSVEGENRNVTEIKREVAQKYQRIVNETQLPRLNEMVVILNNEILDSPQHFTYLIIDDLDKEWVDEGLANQLIRCLFEAVLDMQQVRNLKVLVALRSNLFQQLNYGAQMRGGQEEKFRGHSLTLAWSRNDLVGLLEHRAEAASKFYGLVPPKTLKEMIPKANKTDGDPIDYIMARTLMRPRDVILYLNACVRQATGREYVTWDMLRQAEKNYSEERLLALRDEWKDPYFDIDKVLRVFHGKQARMSVVEFTGALNEVALLVAEESFQGATWLTPMCEAIWSAGSSQKSWLELYGDLTRLLFTLAFIGYSRTATGRAFFCFEDTKKAQAVVELSDAQYFEIHLAFRAALGIYERKP